MLPFIFGLLFGLTSSHTLHMGRKCPTVKPFEGLDINKLLGTWLVAYQFKPWNKCNMWNLTKPNPKANEMFINETYENQFVGKFVNHRLSHTAKVTMDTITPAKMRINWPKSVSGWADFIVIDTDYKTYVVIFECNRILLVHRRDVIVLVKDLAESDKIIDKVRKLIGSFSIKDSLEKVSHEDCDKKM